MRPLNCRETGFIKGRTQQCILEPDRYISVGWFYRLICINMRTHYCFSALVSLWRTKVIVNLYNILQYEVFHRTRLIYRLADTAGRYRPVTDISVSARMFLLNITQIMPG